MAIAAAPPIVMREVVTEIPAVTDRIALLDSEGNIVAVNDKWIALAAETSTPWGRVGPGMNYLEVCRQAGASSSEAREALSGIRAVLKGKAESFNMDYACQTSSGRTYFRMCVTPICYGDARVAVAHVDVTELQLSKESSFRRVQQFKRRLINAQEEERQRISREIHDDLGNRIALLALSVRQIMKKRSKNSRSRMQQLNDVVDHLTELSNAMRDLSHYLHPPLLQYVGIRAALKTLATEFGKTRGLRMEVVVPEEFPPVPDEVELCIFRISQECLQNIAKHSGADSVRIVLNTTPSEVELKVSDTGRGFIESEAVQKGGLGLISMRERVLCIGGRLEVNSSPGAGTEVRAVIPLQDQLSVIRV
jgi:signal transduction histidine kinase